ncbi:NUDIX hydrolase [Parasphingorhabdus sp.]|uniref:NUDIX hydrolase n=2 Tax=Parasphingorhabdus sp. TaxID=2709688 RepID=UPI00326608E6
MLAEIWQIGFGLALSIKTLGKAAACWSYEYMDTSNSNSDAPAMDAITGKPMPRPIPASTLVIFRDQPGSSAPDLLMVERSAKMVFAAGAAVFPGGRVDDADFDFAKALGHEDHEEYGARIAAIRESIEETGIAVAVDGNLDAKRVLEARNALHDGTILAEICSQFDWQLELEKLIPFSRWCPPFAEKRVFDTRFYMISHDDHQAQATVDETENYNLFWGNAQSVLDRAEAGEVKIIFPTKRNLERLAQFGSFDEAVGHTRDYPSVMVSPHIEKRENGVHLCIPEGIGYPITSEAMEAVQRGFSKQGGPKEGQ